MSDNKIDMAEMRAIESKYEAVKDENQRLRAALEFVVDRENLAFAECTVAEEIWNVCKKALENK